MMPGSVFGDDISDMFPVLTPDAGDPAKHYNFWGQEFLEKSEFCGIRYYHVSFLCWFLG